MFYKMPKVFFAKIAINVNLTKNKHVLQMFYLIFA